MFKQDEIDKLFEEQLHDHQVVPSSRVWENIEAELDKESRKRLFIVLPQWMMAAGILLLIGMGTAIYWLLPHQDQINFEMAQQADLLPANDAKTANNTPSQISNYQLIEKQTNSNKILLSENRNRHDVETKSNDLKAVQLEDIQNDLQPLIPRSYPAQKSYNINTKYPKRKYLPFPPAHFDENIAFNQTSPKANEDKWQLGAMVSPTYSYRTTNKDISVSTSGINSLNGGLTVNMKKTKRLTFETGIVYAKIGQEASISNLSSSNRPLSVSKTFAVASQIERLSTENGLGVVKVAGDSNLDDVQMDGTSLNSAVYGFTSNTPNSNVSPELLMTLEYIEIPFSARYYLTSQKLFRLSLSTGLSANFLVGNTTTMNVSNQKGEVSGIDPISYSTRVGLGLDVPLSHSFNINLEPMFKYFITPVNSSSSTGYRPYSMGLNTGISYRF